MTKTEFLSVMDALNGSMYTAPEIIMEFKCKDPIGNLGASKNRVCMISDMIYIEDEMKPMMHIISPSDVSQITISIMKSNKIVKSVNDTIDNFFGMKDKDIIKKSDAAKKTTKKKAAEKVVKSDKEEVDDK